MFIIVASCVIGLVIEVEAFRDDEKLFPRMLGESWLDVSRSCVRDLNDSAHGGP